MRNLNPDPNNPNFKSTRLDTGSTRYPNLVPFPFLLLFIIVEKKDVGNIFA
jgi:uncharacterized membrane protein